MKITMRGEKIEVKEREKVTELLKQEKEWEVWRRLA
jgi:sulfur carrier protein ThiS